MKKSTQLMQRKAKLLQQVRVMGINRVKGPYIHTKCKIQKHSLKREVVIMLDSTYIKLVHAKAHTYSSIVYRGVQLFVILRNPLLYGFLL